MVFMKIKRAPCSTTKLYIHTNMYNVDVDKARFWNLLVNSYPEFEKILNKAEYKALYSIFCYKNGICKFTLEKAEKKFDDKTVSMEFCLDHFEDKINRVIRRYQKENTS